MKKFIFCAIILCGWISVTAQKLFYKSATFTVLSSTSHKTFPGVQGSPIVCRTIIKLVFKKNTSVVFDSFWYNGFTDAITIRKTDNSLFKGDVKKGDTLLLECNYYESTEDANTPAERRFGNSSSKQKPPIKHTGQLVFSYGFVSPQYFFSLKNIRKGQDIYMP